MSVELPADSAGDSTLTSESARAKLPKPPQGHGGYEQKSRRPSRARRKPRRYDTSSSRQKLLDLAFTLAEQRGYEALRISDITDPAGVQRQAFYSHFRDKRHCLCEAISPRLATIERLAASASEQESEWAAEIVDAVDEVLYERFQSADGTKGRLISAMRELLDTKGSLAAIKIGEIVKQAHVPQGDFYKTFSGKRECFAVLYEQVLEETFAAVEAPLGRPTGGSAEPRTSFPVLLETLGEELVSDPDRLRLLVVEAAHLPELPADGSAGAWRGSLGKRIAALLADTPGDSPPDFLAGSVVEVIRSAVATEQPDRIPDRLASLEELRPGSAEVAAGGPPQRLAA